jgi:hypothetical protein
MTVKELIKLLEKCSQDKPVRYYCEDEWWDVEKVEEGEYPWVHLA